MILENGHSQEQAPGITPENLASPVGPAAKLPPENMEPVAEHDLPNCRAKVRRKGGAIDVILWHTGTARLLPRL